MRFRSLFYVREVRKPCLLNSELEILWLPLRDDEKSYDDVNGVVVLESTPFQAH